MLPQFTFNQQAKALQSLVTVSLSQIPMSWRLGQSDYLTPEKDSDASLFHTLAEQLYVDNTGMIVRFVGRERTKCRICLIQAEPSNRDEEGSRKIEREHIRERKRLMAEDRKMELANAYGNSGDENLNDGEANPLSPLDQKLENLEKEYRRKLAAVPCATATPGVNEYVFHMSPLPFAEDVRTWGFPEGPKVRKFSI
jgi:hypothetical protein